jgi:integrase
VLALAANLALRGSEITDLRIRDVDLDERTRIQVRVWKTRQLDDMPINDRPRGPSCRLWLVPLLG